MCAVVVASWCRHARLDRLGWEVREATICDKI